MSKMMEKELLRACFSGDRRAWERFVEEYSKLVYFSIHQTFKMKGVNASQDEANELFNEVFLGLFENNFAKLRNFKWKNDCSLATWLRLITSRKTIDYLKSKRRRSKMLDIDSPEVQEELEAESEVEHSVLDGEREELLRRAVSQLSAEEINFLNLCFIKELAPEKIAEMLGITVSSVYSRKNRIKEKIRKIVKNL